MPHFILDYHGAGIDAPALRRMLQITYETGRDSGIMDPADIKVRARGFDDILMGDGRESLIHVTVLLLAGRTDAMKLALAEALTAALRSAFPGIQSISADIRDMNPDCYKKSLA